MTTMMRNVRRWIELNLPVHPTHSNNIMGKVSSTVIIDNDKNMLVCFGRSDSIRLVMKFQEEHR